MVGPSLRDSGRHDVDVWRMTLAQWRPAGSQNLLAALPEGKSRGDLIDRAVTQVERPHAGTTAFGVENELLQFELDTVLARSQLGL
jgi:hypothetical protein